jgi:hypothetical protein
MRTPFLILAGLSLIFAGTANALTPTAGETSQLLASDGAPTDYFGRAVAVDGDTAVVGAYGDDDLGNESGAVYVFVRDSAGAWNFQQKILPADGSADERFGWVVALDGDTLVVGKESWDFFNPPPGAAYVFTRDAAGVWSEQQKLTAYDGAPGDYFGESVSVSGDTIVIGAAGDDDAGTDSGSAYVFTGDSAGLWNLQQKFTASNGAAGDGFGSQVDIDGDALIIGAPGYDESGAIEDSGMAYVFTRDASGLWTQQQSLGPDNPATGSAFADAVAISGTTAVVGAWGDDIAGSNAGAAYVYNQDASGLWSLQRQLRAADASAGDYFGMAVDVDGQNLVVAAYGDDDNGVDAGSAYQFSLGADGTWQESLKLLASDGLDYDYLGSASGAVGISGSTVIAGARLDDTASGSNAGSAYLFDTAPTGDQPDIALSTTSTDFGDVLVGQTAQRSITVSNHGSIELAISDISVNAAADFAQTNDCPAVLPPSGACEITVTFAPSVEGQVTGTLTILSDDPDEPSSAVTLSGNGISQLPDLLVTEILSPDTLIVNDYATIEVTVANQGTADVAGGYYVHLYLDGSPLGLDWVSQAPAAGASTQLSWFVRIPRTPGASHTLTAVADTDNDILESNEQNNQMSRPVDVQK